MKRPAGIVTASAAAFLFASALVNSASAKDKQVVWEGYATNTGSTTQCKGVGGTGMSDTHVSIFRPHIEGTDTPTYLSMMHLRAALTIENNDEGTVHQMHGNGSYKGYGVNSRAKGFNYWGGTYSLTITPATIGTGVSKVTITGTITKYFNTPGCNVTFKGVYVKRID